MTDTTRVKLTSSMLPRVFVVVLLCSLGTLAMTYSWAVFFAPPAFTFSDTELIRAIMQHGERERCIAKPSSWTFQTPGGFQLYAYSARNLISDNPDAPALDDFALWKWRQGAYVPMRIYASGSAIHQGKELGGAVLVPLDGDGPCSLIQMIWTIQPEYRSRLGLGFIQVLLLLAGALTIFLVHTYVTRPLIVRISRIRAHAEDIGSEDYRHPQELNEPHDELGEIAAALERAHLRIRQDAQELDARRQAFKDYVQDIVHDIRTPMTSLSLALQELTHDAHDLVEDSALTRAIFEVSYMASLITNLQLATKLTHEGTEHIEFTRLNLNELLFRVHERHKTLARSRNISTDCAFPDDIIHVMGNAPMLEQALSNVIQNAIVYNNTGGNVAVLLSPTSDGFDIMVLDDGPGVPPEHLDHLSERSFRTDAARERRPEGDGLGLAIVAAVCECHGWTLTMKKQEPQGLGVTISFASTQKDEEHSGQNHRFEHGQTLG